MDAHGIEVIRLGQHTVVEHVPVVCTSQTCIVVLHRQRKRGRQTLERPRPLVTTDPWPARYAPQSNRCTIEHPALTHRECPENVNVNVNHKRVQPIVQSAVFRQLSRLCRKFGGVLETSNPSRDPGTRHYSIACVGWHPSVQAPAVTKVGWRAEGAKRPRWPCQW